MTGAHRRPAQRPVVLVARAIVPLTLLALTAVGIYFATTDPAGALYVVTALQGALLIFVFGDIARSLLRKPARSPAERAHPLRRVLLPVGGMLFSLSLIGQRRGWLNDGAESALAWTACALYIGAAVWTVGERRLKAVLAARAAAKQGPSE